MTKVGIIFGFAEGRWHSKKLRAELEEAGLTIATHAHEADIIIAHSGGCFFVPEQSNASLILLVGIPFLAEKKLRTSMKQKFRQEPKDSWWFKKTVNNTYYFFRHPRTWVKMARHLQNLAYPSPAASVLLVRNQDDSFSIAEELVEFGVKKNWKMVSFKGAHDDLWKNPEPYVKIIKQHLE